MRLNWALALLFVIAPAAQAQNNSGPGRGRFRGPNIGFTTLDTNGDGTLNAAEIEAAPKELAKLDKNLDGQITSDEIRMAMPQGRGPGGPGGAVSNIAEETVKTLMAFDANGDGKLSKAELPGRFQGLFERGDTDKDGFLTPDEIRKMAAVPAAPTESGGRGGGRGGGREMNFIRMDPILAAIDTNGDGTISAEELRNAPAAIRKLDKDGDGSVTREEATPATRGRGFPQREQL
jgi:Ca2+-binding EF-hand superfamily protein